MVKILIGALLTLATANAMAENVFIYEDQGQQASNAPSGNMYIHRDKGGQVLLTNVKPSGNFDKFTKKVKVTYYKDSDEYARKSKESGSNRKQDVTYGMSSNSNSTSYANAAYLSLR